MKTLFKMIAIAAAFGLAPAASAQAPETSAADSPGYPALPSMEKADLPPMPSAVSDAPLAAEGEEPTEAEVTETVYVSPVRPEQSIGQPDGRATLQEQVTPTGEEAAWFHNWILMPAITIITLFVLALMAWVIVRYRRAANPIPSRTTHNTILEVAWTLAPVLILVIIAVPSIRLLAHQYSPPEADLTVKVIGNQWYWTYEYPDHGIELVSNMLSDEEAAARGEPRMLAVDERLVVPAGATVKLIVTSNDVIHSFGVPAFWVKMDAVPGRLNETWFQTDRPGLYYGQCYELCGARHAYMPIAVEVVPPAVFAQWIASKGGTLPEAGRAGSDLVPAAAPGEIGPADATAATPAPADVVNATAQPAVSEQSAREMSEGVTTK